MTGTFCPILYGNHLVIILFQLFCLAIICNTPFVEPPNDIIVVIAFSIDFLLIMSLGFMSFSNNVCIACTALT